MKNIFTLIVLFFLTFSTFSQEVKETPKDKELGHEDKNKFRQMYDLLATPNRRNRLRATGPMVFLVNKTSESYQPEMNKPLEIKEIKSLDEFINTNFKPEEIAKFDSPKYFYEVTFNKPGGLVMPIIVELTFEDGTTENHKFPAQIWRMNDDEVTRTFATKKVISKIVVDPKLETADIDVTNNTWPKVEVKSKFE